jgi:hypothetical protein
MADRGKNRGRGPDAERAAKDRLLDRLTQAFPDIPKDAITRAVEMRYQDFEGSPVRDFIPVLVERSVKQQLAAGA